MKNMMKETRSERESLNKTLSCKFVYCYFINKLEVSAVDSQNNKKIFSNRKKSRYGNSAFKKYNHMFKGKKEIHFSIRWKIKLEDNNMIFWIET